MAREERGIGRVAATGPYSFVQGVVRFEIVPIQKRILKGYKSANTLAMIPRDLQPTLLRGAGLYPVVTLTGPRQSGKTTLCKESFPHKPYVSLEPPAFLG